MLNLLLVGDKTFSKTSHKILEKWFDSIIDTEASIIMINSREPTFSNNLIKASLAKYKILALGKGASYELLSYGIINHFRLPNPVVKKAKKKTNLKKVLVRCKIWIEGES